LGLAKRNWDYFQKIFLRMSVLKLSVVGRVITILNNLEFAKNVFKHYYKNEYIQKEKIGVEGVWGLDIYEIIDCIKDIDEEWEKNVTAILFKDYSKRKDDEEYIDTVKNIIPTLDLGMIGLAHTIITGDTLELEEVYKFILSNSVDIDIKFRADWIDTHNWRFLLRACEELKKPYDMIFMERANVDDNNEYAFEKTRIRIDYGGLSVRNLYFVGDSDIIINKYSHVFNSLKRFDKVLDKSHNELPDIANKVRKLIKNTKGVLEAIRRNVYKLLNKN